MKNLFICLCLMTCCLLTKPGYTQTEEEATPESTQKVLRQILQLSLYNLPASSSCRIFPAEKGQEKLADWLSMQLAYLQAGQNSLHGLCKARSCELIIKHQHGESVYSSYLRYRLKHNQAESATLTCLTIP